MKTEFIPLSEIDRSDRTFAFRRPGAPEALCRSIERWGVLTPLLLRGRPGAWTVVSGHRRAAAAEAARLEDVPAVTASADSLPVGTAVRRLVEENRFGPALTVLEAGRLLAKLCDPGGETPQDVEAAALLLGLPRGRRRLERILAVPALPEEILDAPWVKDGVLLQLVLLPESARDLMWRAWIEPRRPSVQEVREVVEWIGDMAAGDGSDPENAIRTALQGGGPFFPGLRALRFPTLAAMEEGFRKAVRNLPAPMKATLPPRAEGDGIRFQIVARSTGELAALVRELARREPDIEAVFKALCEPSSREESSSNPEANTAP
ncbi:MAG: hypothetical protein ACYS47_09490 [Planctomycetota bacterium]|jgi:hypothetical protein